MKNNDTNDPLPEDENLGSAGSPHSTGRNLHQRSADFERTEQGTTPAHCEVCGAAIPPTHNRCPDHQRSTDTSSSAGGYTWSISNIGVVIVAASSKFAALANASVALRRRDGGEDTDDSYDLIYDLGEPSDTLTSGWGGELPDAVKLDTTVGQELCERAISKTDGDSRDKSVISGVEIDPSILGESSTSKPHLFTERGKAIAYKGGLEPYEKSPDNPNHDYWVVPALLYERDSETAESSPQRRENQDNADRASPTVGDEKPINKAGKEQFESVMERLEAEGELDGASDSR